jgi:hypothetical protein
LDTAQPNAEEDSFEADAGIPVEGRSLVLLRQPLKQ